MAAKEVEEFAQLLIKHVRDRAVATGEISLSPRSTSATALRWRRRLQAGEVTELLTEAIADCVDDALFFLLNAIDQGLLKISFTASSGRTVNLTELGDGEMSGWYMATQGWRSQYSEERFNDDFADLV